MGTESHSLLHNSKCLFTCLLLDTERLFPEHGQTWYQVSGIVAVACGSVCTACWCAVLFHTLYLICSDFKQCGLLLHGSLQPLEFWLAPIIFHHQWTLIIHHVADHLFKKINECVWNSTGYSAETDLFIFISDFLLTGYLRELEV